MSEITKDPLIRGILLLVIIVIAILAVMLVLDLYFSAVEGKLIFTGVTTLSDIYGYIVGGILVLGWGFFVPIYFASKRGMKGYYSRDLYLPREIADAISMYYKGLITKDELIQIIDRSKSGT
ncbi:hypothetical protein HS7_02800 [Sulfolobales archaeon HS-7]|nr:hypothetical protein HS7_02800 [Sulfolobales archaeon HS-7]